MPFLIESEYLSDSLAGKMLSWMFEKSTLPAANIIVKENCELNLNVYVAPKIYALKL